MINVIKINLVCLAVILVSSCGSSFKDFVSDLANLAPEDIYPDRYVTPLPTDDEPVNTSFSKSYVSVNSCVEKLSEEYDKSAIIYNKLDDCFSVDKNPLLDELNQNIQTSLESVKTNLEEQKSNQDREKLKETAENLAELYKKYDELQNAFAYCRAQKFIESDTVVSPAITEEGRNILVGNMMLNSLGDAFGSNAKGFEGGTRERSLKHRISYLKALKELMNNRTFIKDKFQSHPCGEIENLPFEAEATTYPDFLVDDLDFLITQNENALKLTRLIEQNSFIEARKELISQMDALEKEGESLFMMTGWYKHAVAFQIELENSEKRTYSISLFNSGSGIAAYHASTVKGYEVQYLPSIKVTGLSKSSITSLSAIKALININNAKEDDKLGAAELYEKVLFSLGGKASDDIYDVDEARLPQQAGTCSYFSQSWLLESTLDKRSSEQKANFLPHRLELLFGLKTINDYHNKFKTEYGDNFENATEKEYKQLALVEKSITFMSADLYDADLSNIVGIGLLEAANETQADFKNKVMRHKKELAGEFSEISLANIANIEEEEEGNEKKLPKVVSLLRPKSIDIPEVADTQKVSKVLLLESFANDDMSEMLQSIAATLRAKCNSSSVPIDIYVGIRELVKKFVIEYKLADFAGSNNYAEDIKNLKTIQSCFIYSTIKLIANGELKENSLATTDLLTVVKLLSIADKIEQEAPIDEQYKKLPSMYQKRVDKLLQSDVVIVEAHSAQWQELLKELRVYYEGLKKSEFFQLELMPAGAFKSRKLYYDAKPDLPANEKDHWSFKFNNDGWNDLVWTIEYIQRHDNYDTWLNDRKDELNEGFKSINTDDNSNEYYNKYNYSNIKFQRLKNSFLLYPIPPHMYKIVVQDSRFGEFGYIKEADDSLKSIDDAFEYKNIDDTFNDKRPAPESRINNENITREHAIKLLSNAYNNRTIHLPQEFFHLRQMSYELDFLLTGQLDKRSAQRVNFAPVGVGKKDFSSESLKSTDKKITDAFYYTHETDYNNYDSYSRSYRKIWTKKIPKIEELTVYKGKELSMSVFGLESSSMKDKISEYVHLQNGALPFDRYTNKYGVEKTGFDIKDLMTIYSTNIKISEEKFGDDKEKIATYDSLKLQERRRLFPNDLILLDPKEKYDQLALERVRGVFNLSSCKELQLVETIAIFSKYPSLLGREEYQRLFERLMLEPGLMLDQLKVSEIESDNFVLLLKEFFAQNYSIFRKIGHLKAMLFLLHMNQLLYLQIAYAQNHVDEGFKVRANLGEEIFIEDSSAIELIYQVAREEWPHEYQKHLAWTTLISAFKYVPKLKAQELAYLLLAISKRAYLNSNDAWKDPYMEWEIKNILSEKKGDIIEHMKDDNECNHIINFIAQHMEYISLPKNLLWKRNCYLGVRRNDNNCLFFKADTLNNGKAYVFNAENGMLNQEGMSKKKLSVDESKVKEVFGDLELPKTANYGSKYNGEQYSFEREINNVTEEFRILKLANSSTYYQRTFKELYGKQIFEYMDAPELTQGFKPGMIHFKGKDKNGQTLVLIFSPDDRTKPRYISTSASMIRYEEDGSELSLDLLLEDDGNNPIKDLFTRVEESLFIEAWRDDEQLVEVNLPRLGLRFKKIEGTNDLDCAHHSKHRLASIQTTHAFGPGPKNYIVCEAREGVEDSTPKRIALVPQSRFTIANSEEEADDNKNSFTIDFTIDYELTKDKAHDNSRKILTYQLPDLSLEGGEYVESKEIKAFDNTGILYLALRKWWTHDYLQSYNLLHSADWGIAKLSQSKGEVKILEWLLEGRGEKAEDMDPRADAIRVLVASILIEQVYDHEISTNIKGMKSIIQTVYLDYLKNIKLLGNWWIDAEAEYVVAEYLSDKPTGSSAEIISNRIKVLQHNASAKFAGYAKTHSFIAGWLKHKGGEAVEYKLANSSITSFYQLEYIFQKNDNYGFSTSPVTGAGVLEAENIFSNKNFGLLYNIAAKHEFDKNKAIALLQDVVGYGIAYQTLSDEELRAEFLFLFATTSLYKDREKAGNQRARFFSLLAQLKKDVPTWGELKGLFNKIESLETEKKNNEKTRDEEINLMIEGLRKDGKDPLYINQRVQEAENQSIKEYRALFDQIIVHEKTINDILKDINAGKKAKPKFLPKLEDESKEPVKEGIEPSDWVDDDEVAEGYDGSFIAELTVEDPMETPFATEGLLKKIFNKTQLDDDQRELNKQRAEELTTKLDPETYGATDINNNIAKRLEAVRNKIRDYQAQENKKQVISYKDNSKSEQILNDIASKLDKARLQRDEILEFVKNAVEKKSSSNSSVRAQLLRLAQVKHEFSIDDMLYLLLTNKLGELQRAVVDQKSKTQLEEIADNLINYMLQVTYIRHLEELKATLEHNTVSAEDMYKLLRQKRSYDYKEHFEYLIFEYFMGMNIREDQVKALDALVIKNGSITNTKALGPLMEMIMGFGKTSVLLPLLSAMMSNGEWLNIIMLPDALIDSMSRDLKNSIGKSFGRLVQVLKIKRSDYKVDNKDTLGRQLRRLERLYHRLIRARMSGITMITTSGSMQSLFLSFIETLESQKSEEIAKFVDIFRYMREFGILTIDEIDEALDVLKAYQFSSNNSVPINEAVKISAFAFYRLLITDENIKTSISLPFLEESSGAALTAKNYEAIKEQLIEKMTDKNTELFRGTHVNRIYQSLLSNEDIAETLKAYWSNIDAANNRADLFKKIDTSSRSREAAMVLKNIAVVIYEEINHVFPLTALKKLEINYGSLPMPSKDEDESAENFSNRLNAYKNSRFIAIPYHAGNAMENSRFGTELEAINYTLQMHIEQREFLDQLELRIESLKKNALKVTDDTVANKLDELVRFIDDNPPKDVFKFSAAHLEEINSRLKNEVGDEHMELRLDLIKDYVLPQLKTHNKYLFTSAQIFQSMFKQVMGFSGTLWSHTTFPDIFTEPKLSDTTQKTFTILWQQTAKIRVLDHLPEQNADNYVTQLMTKIYANDYSGSLLDQGGMLRGVSGLEIAKHISNNLPETSPYKGILYYDEDNQISVLNKETGESAPIAETDVAQNERVAFWDKSHTTGSDFKLAKDMTARMSFDKDIKSRDLEQTVWRLRGLMKGQSINEYVVLKEDMDLIKNKLAELFNISVDSFDNFGLGELLLYAVVNQEDRLGDLLHRSLKQKMSNAVITKALDRMFAGGLQSKDILSIYDKFQKLFVRHADSEPYEIMGIPSRIEEASSVVEKDKAKALNQRWIKALSEINTPEENIIVSVKDQVDTMVQRVKDSLPSKLKTSDDSSGLEVEIEMEVEKEQEQEKEEDRAIENYTFNSSYKRYTEIAWPQLHNNNYFTSLEDVNDYENKAPLIPVNAVINHQGESGLAKSIGNELMTSLNFAPMHQPKGNHYKFSFFSLYQKPITNVLIVRSYDSLKVIILDSYDAKELDKALRDGEAERLSEELLLYNLEAGAFRVNKRIDIEALKKDERFIKLITQVKFLNGDIHYSTLQKEALKAWIEDVGEDMYKVFMKALHHKQDSKDAMKGSDINEVFESLGFGG